MTSSAGKGSSSGFKYTRPGPVAQFFISLVVQRVIPTVFGLLRRFAPVFRFPFTNTVLVTSFDYVQEVCARHNDFTVPYQRQVDHLDWVPTFLLAMKDTPAYWETMKQVKALWRTEDLAFVREIAKDVSENALDKAGDRIDAIQELMVPVTEAVIGRYYGVSIPADIRQDFFDGAMYLAGFLFGSQNMTPASIAKAQSAVAVVWEVIDASIAAAHKTPLPDNTIIGRCIADKVTDDKHLRSYLMGMILGYLPTNTIANGHALGVIMNNADGYKYGVAAAEKGDYDMVLKVVHESLRISYILPGLWRTTSEDQELGLGTGKSHKIAKGRMIYFSLMSAMMDSRRIPDPNRFDPNRPRDVYMIYGYQFHYCVGAAIADVMMEEIFMALLRRAPKQAGKVQYNGNFIWNMPLSYKN
ncbi:cytochrome P450 [Kordiimonas marina]|uniref:cytochrome P450 n=1 Tax=Kordiimonas marina TaxID=2872312 RepID=UPI001FF1625D|nr:cytochrome P450 [Kordiimonas marina]MCJ9429332.1 cytochrome P450 [Kordiimonas marina]